jgi:uncharacterized protein (TIGR03086 family)
MSPFFKTRHGSDGQDLAMDEISERYRRLAGEFAAVVATVPDDRWAHPSPCEGWSARDVVRHVVDTHGMFLGFVDRSLPPGPSVDDDPVGAFASARDAVQADLDDPERAGAEFDGFFGRRSFASGVDQFLSGDLVIHRWDLGTAAGLDVRLDDDEIARAWKDLEVFGDAARTPGVFGPAVEPPPDADEQTRLLAYTGRRAGAAA